MNKVRTIREAAVAGTFYAAQPEQLANNVTELLAAVEAGKLVARPKALVVPHAGYIYSGPTAAVGYACLTENAADIRRVVLLGPVHRVPVRGLALPGVEAFETPLGRVEIDAEAVASIAALPQIVVSPAAHRLEHSLEVQLPFLQTVLDDFKLVPLAVGDASAEQVADVLDKLWGGPETLIVISSDLSHFHSYSRAQEIDRATVDALLTLRPLSSYEQACGATPVNGLLLAARRRDLKPRLLDLCNSGDTAGDRQRVVGYASIAFYEPQTSREQEIACEPNNQVDANGERGKTVLSVARAAIARELGIDHPAATSASWLREPGACFVTLMQRDCTQQPLRGCIGSLEAHRPLLHDIEINARAAAFADPRFPPLTAAEYEHIDIEVSLLSPLQRIEFASEADALAQLQPGIDGAVFEYGHLRSTFLPQVWEQLPTAREFIAHLKVKAGLAANFWSSEVKLYRYSVSKFKERG